MSTPDNNRIKEELFLSGIEAFNVSEYYEAHEFWEDLWSDFILSDKKFIQGLIQLSVGYFHITNNNKNGAISLLSKSRPKFELYLPVCRGLNVSYILNSINKSIEDLNEIDKLSDFNWSLTPKLEINHDRI